MRKRGKGTLTTFAGPVGTALAPIEAVGYSERRARLEISFGIAGASYGVVADNKGTNYLNNNTNAYPFIIDYDTHGALVFQPYYIFAASGFAITIVEVMYEDEQ